MLASTLNICSAIPQAAVCVWGVNKKKKPSRAPVPRPLSASQLQTQCEQLPEAPALGPSLPRYTLSVSPANPSLLKLLYLIITVGKVTPWPRNPQNGRNRTEHWREGKGEDVEERKESD